MRFAFFEFFEVGTTPAPSNLKPKVTTSAPAAPTKLQRSDSGETNKELSRAKKLSKFFGEDGLPEEFKNVRIFNPDLEQLEEKEAKLDKMMLNQK